eukprot:s7251_g2.t1
MFVLACQRPCTRTILHWPGAICDFQHAWPCPSVQLVKLQGEGGFAQVWQAVFCGRGVAAKKLKTRRDTRSSSLRGVASRGSEAKEKRIRSQSRGKTEGRRCDQPALDILKGKCRSGPEAILLKIRSQNERREKKQQKVKEQREQHRRALLQDGKNPYEVWRREEMKD